MNKEKEKNDLWILGNGFDMALGLPTSYEDFYNFMDLIGKIKKIISEKRKNSELNYDEIVRKNSEDFKCNTVYKVIKESTFVTNIKCSSPIIRELKHYLFKSSKKNNANIYDIDFKYGLYSKFEDIIYLFETIFGDDICLYEKLTYEPNNRKRGIEGALIHLINNTNELDKIKYAQEQLYLIQRGFTYYLKDVVFDIIFKERYTNQIAHTIINRIPEFNDNISKIGSILNFNYTQYFRLYSDKISEKSLPINGTIKYIGGIFGINVDEIENKNKKEKFEEISKSKMRVFTFDYYKKSHDNDKIINSELFDNGCFKYKDYLNSLKNEETNINRIRIYGHSLSLADQDVIKPLLQDASIKNVIVYIYNKKTDQEIEQELLNTNDGKNLIKILYGAEDYKELSEKERNEFNKKFKLIEMNNTKLEKDKDLILEDGSYLMEFTKDGHINYKKSSNSPRSKNNNKIIDGHSLSLADQDSLKSLLQDASIKNIIVHIYNEKTSQEIKQELLNTNEGKNLIKMLYGVKDYKELSEKECNEFNKKFELIEMSKVKLTVPSTIYAMSNLLSQQQAAYQENNENFKTNTDKINEGLKRIKKNK